MSDTVISARTYRAILFDLDGVLTPTARIHAALSGVASGRNGGFGLVVSVDRGAGHQALLDHGANVVVSDLADLPIGASGDAEEG